MEAIFTHLTSSPYVGRMEAATVVGTSGVPGRGPFSKIYLQLVQDRIAAATFQTYGCGHAIACCSKLCEMVTGLTRQAGLALSAEQLEQALGGLPRAKRHCAPLAIAALQDALAQPAGGAS